ncbi:preprotein translocase subunit SecG [Nitrospirillum sp. BR 11752]|uniref:Protein-export membrane protein SecG n=1 Tax=Nitrospirillum amazonense TaxID=28077 RepID=A0A560HE67_9PROT|nr:preprotein translocase subunit SecG [Nitrospirillum amazonense]MEE3627276.1 preprotein translocase subunit SecG [Nitrospirillum sp. BR 11752]TWB44331.1 protein translocase subunit secG [Nitrospirillum amazonense]
MSTVVLVLHILIGIALVGVVLVQRSEGGGLGMGGGTMGGFMTARGSANLLTRTTSILFGAFLVTSLVLALLNRAATHQGSVFDKLPAAPVTAPAPATPAPGAVPTGDQPAAPAAQQPAPATTTPAPSSGEPKVPTGQ